MKSDAGAKNDDAEPAMKDKGSASQKAMKQAPGSGQRALGGQKVLETAAISTCANILNVDALRRTRKRNFDEGAEVSAEHVTAQMMREWNGPLKLAVRNISRTTDKQKWAVKALRACLKK